jgi:hypothetical protein
MTPITHIGTQLNTPPNSTASEKKAVNVAMIGST